MTQSHMGDLWKLNGVCIIFDITLRVCVFICLYLSIYDIIIMVFIFIIIIATPFFLSLSNLRVLHTILQSGVYHQWLYVRHRPRLQSSAWLLLTLCDDHLGSYQCGTRLAANFPQFRPDVPSLGSYLAVLQLWGKQVRYYITSKTYIRYGVLTFYLVS